MTSSSQHRRNRRTRAAFARVVTAGAVLTLAALTSGHAHAAGNEAVTATVENDVLTGSDNAYTNGLGLTWVSDDLQSYRSDSALRRWSNAWRRLPFVRDPNYRTYASWSLVQEMHTPDDIHLADPPTNDQPYAGVLYVDNVIYARAPRWSHAWELKLGVAGPASGAAMTQREFHHLIGVDKPRGWSTQVPNEPIVNVGLTSAHLWREGDFGGAAQWRVIPVVDAAVGNYFTGAGAGVYGEFGWHLADAFAGTSLRGGLNAASTVGVTPTSQWSLSFFGGLSGHAVAHYLPLDGTLFRESRSVDSRPFVGAATAGAALRHGPFVVSLAVNYSTRAFDGQKEGAEFGTLSVSWFPQRGR